MNNKVLMVTYSYEFNGGAICSDRNYRALCSIYGENNIEIFDLAKYFTLKKSNIIKRLFNFIHGKIIIDTEIENLIINKCKNISILFIDRSIYSLNIKKIKNINHNIKVITFFHNMELDFHKNAGFSMNVLLRVYRNEKTACKYSDITIAINNRDVKRIEKVYKKKIDAVIPVSFPDKEINFNKESTSKNPTALFFGSNFLPNIHGIKWFVKNVLPYVNIKLQVIMKDIEKENLPKSNKLEILGFVKDLEYYIQKADFVIFPIFKGSGMKIKTCEALMYGKNIIGSGEIFEGYNIDFDKVGAKCETSEEFINAINEFPNKFKNKFNEYSRNVFLEKYNDKITFRQFADVLKSI